MAERELDLLVKATTDKQSFATSQREIRKTGREIDRMRGPVTKLGKEFDVIQRGLRTGQLGYLGAARMGLGSIAGGTAARLGLGRFGLHPLGIAAAATAAVGVGAASRMSMATRQADSLAGLGIGGADNLRQFRRVILNLAGGGQMSEERARQAALGMARTWAERGRPGNFSDFSQQMFDQIQSIQNPMGQAAFSQDVSGLMDLGTLDPSTQLNRQARGEDAPDGGRQLRAVQMRVYTMLDTILKRVMDAIGADTTPEDDNSVAGLWSMWRFFGSGRRGGVARTLEDPDSAGAL